MLCRFQFYEGMEYECSKWVNPLLPKTDLYLILIGRGRVFFSYCEFLYNENNTVRPIKKLGFSKENNHDFKKRLSKA